MHRMKIGLTIIFSLLLPAAAGAQDLDHDGLADPFEQQILVKFLPEFRISTDDCDGSPAEFVPGASTPVPLAKNGTIYGQVFRHRGDGSTSAALEVHYYHLWTRDCGRLGHAL